MDSVELLMYFVNCLYMNLMKRGKALAYHFQFNLTYLGQKSSKSQSFFNVAPSVLLICPSSCSSSSQTSYKW